MAGVRHRELVRVAGVALLVGLPFVVAAVVLGEPRWYPGLELAQTEIHVRDVGTERTPLTGLIGRLGGPQERGSHPGPLSFYALAPVYRLLGSSAWALMVSTIVLNVLAAASVVLITLRRGGPRLALLATVALILLLRFLGAEILTRPWNPYLPLLWWAVFLLAVWAVLDDDPGLLPVAAAAGAFCAQTHVSYGVSVGGLGLIALVTTVARAVGDDRPGRVRRARWVGGTILLGAVLWAPPLLDERRDGRGNLSVLLDFFTAPAEDPLGPGRAAELVVGHLDPVQLVFGDVTALAVGSGGWSRAGIAFVVVWALAALVAVRIGPGSLRRFHAVLAVAILLGVLATSRIVGPTWEWLLLWAWVVATWMVVAVAWTAGEAFRVRAPAAADARRVRVAATAVLATVAVVAVAVSAVDAARVEPENEATSAALRAMSPAILRHLDERGEDGDDRYLITSDDPLGVIGASAAFGLADELLRHGLECRMDDREHLRAAPYLFEGPTTATLWVVVGPAIARWESRPDALPLALHDPRTASARAAEPGLRRRIAQALRDAGRGDLADVVDVSFLVTYFAAREDPSVPRSIIGQMERYLDSGHATAVYLVEEA